MDVVVVSEGRLPPDRRVVRLVERCCLRLPSSSVTELVAVCSSSDPAAAADLDERETLLRRSLRGEPVPSSAVDEVDRRVLVKL